jgi:type II secretory pathway component PulF
MKYNLVFFAKKPNSEDILVFTQLFSNCIKTGLSIKESLIILAKQTPNSVLQKRINKIILDIESGDSLSTAFSKHQDIFPVFYSPLLKAGESSGDLINILECLVNYLERMQILKNELITLFAYPITVILFGAFLMTLILIFVAPSFNNVFSALNISLPWPTAILFWFSIFFIKYYIHLSIGVVILLFLFFISLKSPTTRKRIDKFILKIPYFGLIVKSAVFLRILQAFSVLLNNKVPILESLKILEESAKGNMYLQYIIKEMRKDIARGLPLGNTLKNHKIVPPIITYSIATGEKAGNLGLTIERLCVFLDKDLNYTIKKLSSKLDPILTLLVGLFVLFIALAIYLPIFDIISSKGIY